MTSVLRRYSQLEPRTKYLAVLADCSGYTLDVNALGSPLMDVSSFTLSYSFTTTLTVPGLLQDLGRSVTVYDPAITGSPHIAVFRQVMIVQGPGYEGISGQTAYICTWSDGNSIFPAQPVVRTG